MDGSEKSSAARSDIDRRGHSRDTSEGNSVDGDTKAAVSSGGGFTGLVLPFSHYQQPYHALHSPADATDEGRKSDDSINESKGFRDIAVGPGAEEQATRAKSLKRIPPQTTPTDGSFSPNLNYDTTYSRSGAYDAASDSGRLPAHMPSISSFHSGYQRSFNTADDVPFARAPTSGRRSAYDVSFHPPHACPPDRPFYERGCSWFGISLIIFALFSTVFSGIFLVLAVIGKRWGSSIRTGGSFTPSDAIVLTNVFAKAIEMSFVAVVVTFLGQALSRRAFDKRPGQGVTLAELTMRNWILQPGTMFTHPSGVKYGALSVLGAISLVATILSTMYTTAAQALVQPQLRFSDWEPRVMRGAVLSSFANIGHIHANCETPITAEMDPVYRNSTCFQIQNSAQAFFNYQRYMANWASLAEKKKGSSEQALRPPGFGMIYENTTITAPWIDLREVKTDDAGRIITNVSLAFPHPGVYQAARDPANRILQPQDLDGLGLYGVKASVASPVVNALCVETSRKADLDPIVFDAWSNSTQLNTSSWPAQVGGINMTNFKNTTALDDIFGWGPQYGTGVGSRRAYPIFSKYPLPYNTVLNHTQFPFYGRDSIYLLGQGRPPTQPGVFNGKYVICELSASLTPNCSTHYNATTTGGHLEARCDDPEDDLRYIVSNWNATQGNATRSKDWFDVGLEWGNSLSLNTGITDGMASNARLLMQLLLDSGTLSEALPSVAEALAVMAGSTLLFSSYDAPFTTDPWNYTGNTLETPAHQYFNASVRGQEYASGGLDNSSKGFLLILSLVFAANVLILGYLIWQGGLVTDFSESPNLFALALNSPPSSVLAGSCGAGPHGEQYRAKWSLLQEGDHLYMTSSGNEPEGYARGATTEPGVNGDDVEMLDSPYKAEYRTLSKRKSHL